MARGERAPRPVALSGDYRVSGVGRESSTVVCRLYTTYLEPRRRCDAGGVYFLNFLWMPASHAA